jgi:8-oxo-dGTP diphosphatase
VEASEPGCSVRAVCGVVAEDFAGNVLLLRRAGEGTWGLPGGGVDPGETWAQAALRECLEETGWEVELRGLLGIYSDPASQTYRDPNGRAVQFFGVVFLATALRRSGIPDGEASALGFFALDDLPEPLFEPDRPVLEDARNAVGRPFLR